MQFSRSEHIKFLDLELKAQTEQYVKTVQSSAIALLENDEVFSSQFIKFEKGLMILKFKNERSLPRKGEYLTAVLLTGEMASYRNWGNISWAELRSKYQIAFSEAICVFHSSAQEKQFSLAGFRGIDLDFSQKLIDRCIIVLGPKEPPYQYLQNLIKVVNRPTPDKLIEHILDFDLVNNDWDPPVFDENADFSKFILSQIHLSDEVIIQGPPGTGKTHKMAEIASALIAQGKSVLVTALTNRALIELATKPALKEFVEQGQVYKTNVTLDEIHKIPKLLSTKELICRPGTLCLSTFYVSSIVASEILETPPFDFVIMDEASQALLAMFACTRLLGKKVVWIGDPNQLPPVTLLESDVIKRKNLIYLIYGLDLVCKNLSIPSFMLSVTRRLTSRAALYTSTFYSKSIISKPFKKKRLSYSEMNFDIGKYFNPQGGPTLIKTSMPPGDAKPEFAIQFVVSLLAHLASIDENEFAISVLTKLKKTVKEIQKCVISSLGNDWPILIDTIERIQGLTCDVCIFLIPNAFQNMSLEKPLFNVATSRASRHTIIIADKSIVSYPFADKQVSAYLKKLNEEYSFVVEPYTDMRLLP